MPRFDDSCYATRSPVLFVIFNRPVTTTLVFNQIRKAKPPRLYIAADGARYDKPREILLCEQARAVMKGIDWDCELKTLIQERNLGCRQGVPAALDWFFTQEEEGIILEDDCLPANSFFEFCDTLLTRYRFDDRVRHITGCNLHFGRKWGEHSYYFSNKSHVWGWASWKRVWNDYDGALKKYTEQDAAGKIQEIFNDNEITDCWTNIFREVKSGLINAWGYQLDFVNFFNNGLTIIPNENLISNIGFGKGATHTIDEKSIYANIPVVELGEISHPTSFIPQTEADKIILNRDLSVPAVIKKRISLKDRLKNWHKTYVHDTETSLHTNRPFNRK